MLGTRCIGRNEWQIDLRLDRRRELDLGALGSVAQTLQRHLIALAAKIQAVFLAELVGQPAYDALVDVVAAQVGVSVRRFDLDHAFADLEDRDIEGAAAEVIDRNGLVLLFVQPVRQRGRGWLVNNSLHVEPGNLAGVLGGLALRVIEVGRHRNDCFGHWLPQIILGGLLQLLQDHGGDLRRGILLALRHNGHVVARLNHLVGHHLHLFVDFVKAPPHEALDGEDRVLRVGNSLVLGHLPHRALARLGKTHDRRRSTAAFFVGNHLRIAAFHDGDHRVGGSQVDPYDLCHCCLPPACKLKNTLCQPLPRPACTPGAAHSDLIRCR